jgi:hypothetical protein
MGTKLDEEFKSKLQFQRREVKPETVLLSNLSLKLPAGAKQIIISAEYDGIYRQYAYIHYNDEAPEPTWDNEEFARNLVTISIQDALVIKQKYINGEELTIEEVRIAQRMGL